MKRYASTVGLIFFILASVYNQALAQEPKQREITYLKMLPGHISKGESPDRIQVYEADVYGIGGAFYTESARVIHVTYGAEIICRATVTGKDANVYWVLSEGDQLTKIIVGSEARFKTPRPGNYSVALWATNEPGDNTKYNYVTYWRVKME